jgi:hypothetical protein
MWEAGLGWASQSPRAGSLLPAWAGSQGIGQEGGDQGRGWHSAERNLLGVTGTGRQWILRIQHFQLQ